MNINKYYGNLRLALLGVRKYHRIDTLMMLAILNRSESKSKMSLGQNLIIIIWKENQVKAPGSKEKIKNKTK